MDKIKKYKAFLLIAPIILFTLVIAYIGTDGIIQYVGVSNTYLFMFIISFIGGVSIFSGVPYPLFIITFALGGLDIFLLAFFTASGLMLGDCTSYFLGGRAHTVMTGRLKDIFDRLLTFYDTKPKILMPLFFLYGMLSPIPNDMITLSSGMKGYGFFKTMIPLSLGNFMFCLMLGYFADFFSRYF